MITPSTPIKAAIKEWWVVVVAIFVLGYGFSDLKHEIQNTQVQIQTLMLKIDSNPNKRAVEDAIMVAVRSLNKSNVVNEQEVQRLTKEALDRK